MMKEPVNEASYFYVEASLSMGNAEVVDKIDKNGFELGEEASLAKYEAGIDIPISFTNHDLHLGGSLKVSSSRFKVNFLGDVALVLWVQVLK